MTYPYPVWVSLTTIPDRFEKTDKILREMVIGLSWVDKIVLNIPIKYKRFKQREFDWYNHPKVIINMVGEDYGPITKILPTLDIIPNESLLLVCDDEIYNWDAFKIAADKQITNRSKSYTYWKYDYKGVDIPQGVDIISFWTPNLHSFGRFVSMAMKSSHCFYVDDMVIGLYLNRYGISIEQLQRKWKWAWVPDGADKGLFHMKGEYSRDRSSRECFSFIGSKDEF